MKRTAKGYGLRVDSWVDERRDPFKATDAAVRHLADLNRRFGSLYLAAAAYNAGSPRVERWFKRNGVTDPEVFAEQISFVETRDYVRIIQRNEEIYRALYGSEGRGGPPFI